MNRNRLFREPAIAVITALIVFVASSASFANYTTFDLLRIDPTPRGAAFASNALAFMDGDLGALATGPGGLAYIDNQEVSAAYSDHPLDLAGGRFAYGYPSKYGYAALSLSYFSYGSFDRRESFTEEPAGSFTPSDILVTAGFARQVGYGIGVGGAVKYIRGQIDDYTSSAFAVDISAHWRTGWNEVELAAGFSNLGTQLETWDGVDEDLPLMAHAGATKQLEHLPLVLGITGHMLQDGWLWGTLSGEFTVSELLKLRAGYSTEGSEFEVGGSQDGLAGLSLGFGLTHKGIGLDYAFHSQGAVGQVHRLGATYQF